MAKTFATTAQLRFNEAQMKRLDAYRRAHTDPPTRAQAAQELFDRALTEFVDDAVVTQTQSMPSLPLPQMGRPPKRSSVREETVSA
jgi:hypothetical protein